MGVPRQDSRRRPADPGIRVAHLATYPPTECGIATFTQDLSNALDAQSRCLPSRVLAISPDGAACDYPPNVCRWLRRDRAEDYLQAAEHVNASDAAVASVQHEFGIFGGEWGAHLLTFLEAVAKPVVITLHTVLPEPEEGMRRTLARVCRCADAVVVMNPVAVHLLDEVYGVPRAKTRMIHHGVPVFHPRRQERMKRRLGCAGRTVLSTFGLINPGKGIEHAIRAMAVIAARHPKALYLILGQTHPGVRRHSGEAYRESLQGLIAELGLTRHVRFENRYLTKPELIAYLEATDIYVTPYLNPDQMVSGALAYAVGAGKPVISTPYLYALELLGDRRGMIVDFTNPEAIAEAADLLLTRPPLRRGIALRARRLGRRMVWSHVAEQYLDVFEEVLRPHRAAAPTAYLDSGLLAATPTTGKPKSHADLPARQPRSPAHAERRDRNHPARHLLDSEP